MEERIELDIVDLYKKGYSINAIIDIFYNWKTKNDVPSKKIGNIVFLRRKSITKEESKKIVYEEIYNYIK